jgi:hypothetical protein
MPPPRRPRNLLCPVCKFAFDVKKRGPIPETCSRRCALALAITMRFRISWNVRGRWTLAAAAAVVLPPLWVEGGRSSRSANLPLFGMPAALSELNPLSAAALRRHADYDAGGMLLLPVRLLRKQTAVTIT